MKLLIIGAGISGLSAAKKALNCGHQVEIIESSGRIGGMMRSENAEGEVFDIGAYLFYGNNPMFDLFPELLNVMPVMIRPVQCMNLIRRGYIDRFPFSPKGILRNTSLPELAGIILDYLKTFRNSDPETFGEWVEAQIGANFYNRSGLRRYIQRYFGVPDDQVSLNFARDRMAYIQEFRPERVAIYNIRRIFYRPEEEKPHLQLLRPPSGFTEMFEVMKNSLAAKGCRIFMNERILKLERRGGRFQVTTTSRKSLVFDNVILAAPPEAVIEAMKLEKPLEKAKNFSLLSLFFKGKLNCPGDILYNSSPLGKWKRITSFNRLYNETCDKDRFTVEVVVDPAQQMSISDAVCDFAQSGSELGLLEQEVTFCGSTVSTDTYLRLTIDQEQNIQAQRDFLWQQSILAVGRQGEYKYYTSSECVFSAMERVQQLES